MNLPRRRLLLAATGAALLPQAQAQSPAWPSRPLQLVTGGAGSVTDIRARWLAERLSAVLGHAVIVVNNGAAGGNAAAEQVARSTPDGHTLLVLHQGIAAVNPHLYARPGYDPLQDFAPVTRFGYGSLLLTVHPSFPARSVQELVALAKAQPGALNFGSPGNGTPPHLASELFKRLAGIEAVHIPYKGGGALLTAMLGGQISWSMDGITAQLPHVRAGGLRALAVTGSRRSASLGDVPTLAEAGVPGYEFWGWTGIGAPAGTPKAVVDRLNAEIVKLATSDEGRKWFEASGSEPGTQSPEEFAAFIRAEHAKWGRVVREAGLRAE